MSFISIIVIYIGGSLVGQGLRQDFSITDLGLFITLLGEMLRTSRYQTKT